MSATGKWIKPTAIVLTIALGLGVFFFVWDRHYYPLPGDDNPPVLRWPRPFSRLAQPANEFAEKLREKKRLRQEKQWLGLDRLAGTVWTFETNQVYFEDDGNMKFDTSGKIFFGKKDHIRISGEPLLFPSEINNEDFIRYQFHRSNPDELIFYTDTEELRLKFLGKFYSRVPTFAGGNSDHSLDVVFRKIVKPKS